MTTAQADPSGAGASPAGASGEPASRSWWKRHSRAVVIGLTLSLIVVVVGVLRARLVEVPLERDEGDYALGGQLLLDGHRLYRDFYTMRWPGVYAAYAVILSAFGRSTTAIHTALLLLHAATVGLVYVAGRQLYGSICGLSAAALFGVSSSVVVLLGHTANSEHFINLYAVAAFVLLLSEGRARAWRWLAAGLLLGLAFITKQHAAALIVAGWGTLALFSGAAPPYRIALLRPTAIYLAGVSIPVAAALMCVFVWGVFDEFWLWTVEYARSYSGQLTAQDGWAGLRFQLGLMGPVLWPVAVLGLAGAIAAGLDRARRRAFVVLMMYLGASVAMISVGWYFRPHYFLFVCPPLAILGGKGVDAVCARVKPAVFASACAATVIVAATAWVVFSERAYFFEYTPAVTSRVRNGVNPFPESEAIAAYIADRTAPADRVLVLGSEPQIYFHARRPNATGHIHMYPLMESHPNARHMQEELIAQVELAKPEYVVFVPVMMSWLQGPQSDERIFHWFADYAVRHYTLEAVVDIPESGTGELRPFEARIPAMPNVPRIQIYRRNRD